MSIKSCNSIFACLAATGFVLVAQAIESTPAHAHDDYESECCNNRHCSPLSPDKVHRQGAYWVLNDGRRILAGTTRRSSLIGKLGFHICDWRPGEGIPSTYHKQTLVEPIGKPVCLYVPDAEF